MTTQHTPGPKGRNFLTTHVGQDYVAVLREGQTTDDAIVTIKYPSKADIALAHQFAAAEEMLAALIACTTLCEGHFRGVRDVTPNEARLMIESNRAAIAKARGQ